MAITHHRPVAEAHERARCEADPNRRYTGPDGDFDAIIRHPGTGVPADVIARREARLALSHDPYDAEGSW